MTPPIAVETIQRLQPPEPENHATLVYRFTKRKTDAARNQLATAEIKKPAYTTFTSRTLERHAIAVGVTGIGVMVRHRQRADLGEQPVRGINVAIPLADLLSYDTDVTAVVAETPRHRPICIRNEADARNTISPPHQQQ